MQYQGFARYRKVIGIHFKVQVLFTSSARGDTHCAWGQRIMVPRTFSVEHGWEPFGKHPLVDFAQNGGLDLTLLQSYGFDADFQTLSPHGAGIVITDDLHVRLWIDTSF